MIIGDTVDINIDGREAGWLKAHARNRRSPGVVERAPFTRVGGYEAGLRLLERPERPTAVVTGSDLQAVGLLRAARERGLRVPEDLALASFDGTEEASFTWPSLTTSRQPIDEMAKAAVAPSCDPIGRPVMRCSQRSSSLVNLAPVDGGSASLRWRGRAGLRPWADPVGLIPVPPTGRVRGRRRHSV